MANPPGVRDLEERYPDPGIREKLFDYLNLSMILADSIIKKDYQVPPILGQLIQLTDYGQRTYQALRKRSVPYLEARLLCLLEVYHADILIDIDNSDYDAIVRVLDRQVADRTLSYPFVFGRLLYDRYFELYGEDPDRHLSADDTQRLLEGTPQGVAQYGHLTLGPFGIVRSRNGRMITSSRRIPLRHCADPSCKFPHPVFVSSSTEAPINKHRDTIQKILEREEARSIAWNSFMDTVASEHVSSYLDTAAEPVVILMGDALDNTELRKLLDWLLDNTGGRLRESIAGLKASGSAGFSTADLSRAEMLQLALLSDNDAVITGIDTLVRKHVISVPPGEIRTPVVNYLVRFGRHGLRAELGPYGVRVDASGSSLAPLRTKKLVEQMYRMEDEQDRRDLTWQMREEPSDSLDAKLEHYLQTKPPKEAIGNLVLSRWNNVVVATTSLGLGDITAEGDEAVTNAVLWKLGFTVRSRGQIHDDFWRAHDSMLHQARQGVLSTGPAERQDIRGAAGNYFPALETLLDDSLAYITWALCTDHYTSTKPYVYRPHIDRAESYKLLNEFGAGVSNSERLGAKNTLAPLINGFARLANYLEHCEGRSDELLRAPEDMPDWVDVQSLRAVPVHSPYGFPGPVAGLPREHQACAY